MQMAAVAALGTAAPGINIVEELAHSSQHKSSFGQTIANVSNSQLDQSSETLGLNFIMAATAPGSNMMRSAAILSGLVIVVFLQLTLMPCKSHMDCNHGKYCCACNQHCKDCADTLASHT